MSRFLKKRVPAFLMTLVMVTTLIPMASAKSSADIEYEVDAGDNVTLEFSDFQNYYDKYESDNLYRMEFTDLTDVDSNGRMYAVDFEGDEVRVNEDDLYNSWFYASKSDVEDSGEYRIKGMNYSAGSKADGETAELAFTLYGDKKGELEGILRIYIGSSGSSKSGTISYSVKSGEEVAFDEDDFQKLYDDSSCTGTFKYVEFDRPSTSEYANGTIYSRYNTRKEVAFSRSDFSGTTFGYSDYADGDYDLSDLSFVADSSFTSGSITLSFTLYGGTGSRTNQSTTGTLKITSGKSSSTTSKGDITYTVKAGSEVSFDEDDFQKLYDKSSCTGTFKYLVFDRPSTSEYANGTIYSRYGKRNETSFSRSALNGNSFGYSDYADGDYDLSDLSFVADKAFTSGSITLSFTLYGGTGSRTNQSTTGTLKITSGKSSSTTSKGDITYTVKAGSEVSFDEDDFQKLYDKSSCTGTFKYLVFDRPSTSEYANGTIYSRYGKRNETSFSRSALNGNSFGYSDYADGDYDLSDLSFVADKSFSGSITLSFTLYGGTGSRTNQSTTGTLVITSGNSSSIRSYYVGNIRYSVTPGTALQINPNDIARYFKKCSGGNLMYVTLISLPATGSLYYNYYGTSQYGASSRTQMTAASAAGRMFAYSPSAKTEYALSELTYIPSGANYCTAIGFTAYGGNGQSYTGSILISVSTQAVPEIYSVTTKGTSVSFPATAISSAVSGATGASFSSIQLLDLPATTSGAVYYGSSVANTTSQYAYANLSQLRFVPNSNFTGSVSIPYVALNSSGTAMAMGQFSIGVVSSVKKFSDVATTTWCYKYVTELSSANIISGYSNGSFQEKNTITYGAALKLIMLAAGYGEQAPTVKGSTFSGYLAKAKADGLVTGNPKLNGSITRLQIAQIASKALKLSTTNLSNKKPFTDTNDVYVQALNAAGIIEGYFSNGTSTYKPNSTLTRGQVSAIVWRMRNYEK
ncbi:S-layer homology domain-containing protein [uncultured Dysosmobacter sp.]|uniref:S-layer homology domain-containing protein n=1 Tax=uncultured Dysosmobacter sp. TaxID=2591384 RepID=UPI0026723678|nr:S-layer homology domain-containing protein [uncultured Dysosmobacter sp.]